MTFIDIDIAPSSLTELHEGIDAAYHRFATLVRALEADPPVGRWTTTEVTAHLVTVMNRYTAFAPHRLAADPRGVDEINDRELAELRGTAVGELLEQLDDEMTAFRTMWGPASGIPLDLQVPFHGGGTIDVQSVLTNAMGEFLLHGFDVARAAHVDWPIGKRDAALLCRFGSRILPFYIRRTNTSELDIGFDIATLPSWTMEVRGSSVIARVGGPSDRSSVSIHGDPASMILVLYERLPLTEAVAAGRLQVTDRRPDASHPFELTEIFEAP